MKKFTLLFAFVAVVSFLNAQTFLYEDFSDNQMPPTGWSIDGYPANWSTASSANAGGSAPEGKFTYSSNNGISRLISPQVDLTGYAFVTLAFNHYYDYYEIRLLNWVLLLDREVASGLRFGKLLPLAM